MISLVRAGGWDASAMLANLESALRFHDLSHGVLRSRHCTRNARFRLDFDAGASLFSLVPLTTDD